MNRPPNRRRLGVAAALAAAAGGLVAGVPAAAASDVLANIGPASQLGGGALVNAYPLGHYALDHHFAAVEAGVFSGVDTSGIAPMIAWFLANAIWTLTAFLANATITLFTFAFSLDLVNGSSATGGAGALAPVGQAVRAIYRTVFGGPWLVAAITVTGLWAIWHALVRRRYTDTAGALGVSVAFVVIALVFVTQPERTIGQASRWTNDMSAAFLSLAAIGGSGSGGAKQQAADQLFALLVYEPWVVLQFGGREHCVRAPVDEDGGAVSVAVRPLSRDSARDSQLSRRLARSDQVRADGKVCINAANKYAPRFLAYPSGSEQRDRHYEALEAGDTSKAPESDRDGYRLSAADTPAAEAMGAGGQFQRLLLAVVIFAGELGGFLLVAALSAAVILAQVLLLLLVAFAPVALVIGVIPGRGHDFFRAWLARLASFLVRKAAYSLILAILLAVIAAVGQATANLGWLMAFGLQAAFFWAVLLWRRQLVGQITHAATGDTSGSDSGTRAVRLASLYGAAHLAGRAWRHRPRLGSRPARDTNRRSHRDDGGVANDPPAPAAPPAPAGPPASPRRQAAAGGDSATTPAAQAASQPADSRAGTAATPPPPTAADHGPGRADTPAPRSPDAHSAGEAGQRSARDERPDAAVGDRAGGGPGDSPLTRGLSDDERRLRPPATDDPDGDRPAPPTAPADDREHGRRGDDRDQSDPPEQGTSR